MKALVIVISCIVVFCLGFVTFALVKNSQEQKKIETDKRVKEETTKTIMSAEDKMHKAQQLLSKKKTSLKEQEEARKLIDESIAEAKKSTEMLPNNPQPWFYLSEKYAKLVDLNPKAVDLATDALNHAIKLAPNNDAYHENRATMYMYQKKYVEAEKDLQKAVAINPKKANYYFKLGNVYKETNRFDSAHNMYTQAKKLTQPENHLALAMIYAKEQELDKKATQAAHKRK